MNSNSPREGRQHPNLWSITRGERLHYLVATLCSTISNVCMLGIPLAGMYALDVLIEGDLGKPGPYRDLCEIQDLLDETIQYETELAANG